MKIYFKIFRSVYQRFLTKSITWVEALGVGKSLTYKELYGNPTVFLDAINAVLTNPCFAENAQRMQSILKNYQPAKTAADIIEQYMETKVGLDH